MTGVAGGPGGGAGLHRPAGSTGSGDTVVDIDPESAGWAFSGLRVVEVPAGGRWSWSTGGDEALVLPLTGSCRVETADGRAELAGRASVFHRPSDCAYVPRDSDLSLHTAGGGRFAVATARADHRRAFRHVTADEVRVELRGAGVCSRQVNNLGTPDVLDADRLIVCEVLTPGGNWSSFPPHKHDTAGPAESVLEEIYYFEVDRGGPAYQRVYGTAERPIDVLAEVRSGDVVLVPYGWHGPSIASPGHDLYYLNVMAGPGARSWLICDDPAHAGIRDTWVGQAVDPRLPMRRAPMRGDEPA